MFLFIYLSLSRLRVLVDPESIPGNAQYEEEIHPESIAGHHTHTYTFTSSGNLEQHLINVLTGIFLARGKNLKNLKNPEETHS